MKKPVRSASELGAANAVSTAAAAFLPGRRDPAPAISSTLRLTKPIQGSKGVIRELELRALQHETAMNILKRHRHPIETLIRLLARGACISDEEAGSLCWTDFIAAVDVLTVLFERSEDRLLQDLLSLLPASPQAAH